MGGHDDDNDVDCGLSTTQAQETPRIKSEEKPMMGPSVDGNIKVVYKSAIDGYENDNEELAKMEALGLPTGFEFGNMSNGSSSLRTKKAKQFRK